MITKNQNQILDVYNNEDFKNDDEAMENKSLNICEK